MYITERIYTIKVDFMEQKFVFSFSTAGNYPTKFIKWWLIQKIYMKRIWNLYNMHKIK